MANILIIDDEEVVRATLVQAMERSGHTVFAAVDGRDGLKKFHDCAVDLVITDILMPNMEGIETIRELRSLRQDISIIVISGGNRLGNVSYLDAAMVLGADMMLRKPFAMDDLRCAVDHCLGKKAYMAVV